MLDSKFKKLILASVVTLLCGTAQMASAHTGIKDSAFIEGQGNTGISVSLTTGAVAQSATAYDAFTITHGCASNTIPEGTPGTTHRNVIAMAALFPNSAAPGSSKVYRYKTGSISTAVPAVPGVDGTVLTGVATTLPVSSPADLTDDINGAIAGGGLTSLGLGLVSPNLFGNAIKPIQTAADGTAIRGYAIHSNAKSFALEEDIVSATGLSPFKFTVPTFKSTSCAANLIVRVAVSNWCTRGASTAGDRKDVWIGTDTGSKTFSMMGPNAELMPNSVATLGGTGATLANEQGNGTSFWPKFVVHRNLVTNPLPASCNGESYDVVVEPSGTDIDANLAIKGYN